MRQARRAAWTIFVPARAAHLYSIRSARSGLRGGVIRPKGTRVTVMDTSDGWAHVQANGAEGYINLKFLR